MKKAGTVKSFDGFLLHFATFCKNGSSGVKDQLFQWARTAYFNLELLKQPNGDFVISMIE